MIDQKLLQESVILSCRKILKEISEEGESVADLEKEKQEVRKKRIKALKRLQFYFEFRQLIHLGHIQRV